MHLRTRRILLVLVTATLAGCASAGSSTPESSPDPVAGRELESYVNLDLALRELRPSWLRRSREVFLDKEYFGDVSILRRSFTDPILYIELVPAGDVVRVFGPCQAPSGTGVVDRPRDPQCGTRPIIHIVRFAG